MAAEIWRGIPRRKGDAYFPTDAKPQSSSASAPDDLVLSYFRVNVGGFRLPGNLPPVT
jgi:hypothetical protein